MPIAPGVLPTCVPTAAIIFADSGNVKVFLLLFALAVIHCILVSFGEDNHGEHARPLKRFAFIAIQYLCWLWAFLGIGNSGITVFSSDLLETVVTTTESQNIT